MAKESDYRGWQQKLSSSLTFRRWWQFWSNYSFVFFVIAGLLLVRSENITALIVLTACSFIFARLLVTTLINLVYKKQRPYQKFNFNPITSNFFSLRTSTPNSFPSRHSIAFSAVAGSVFVFNPVIGLVLLVVTAITGIGRVILGYHWPSDIVAGVVFGSITGYFVTFLGLGLFFT